MATIAAIELELDDTGTEHLHVYAMCDDAVIDLFIALTEFIKLQDADLGEQEGHEDALH